MDAALQFYMLTLHTVFLLVMPFITIIAAVGVLASFTQALFGISDQNVSFGPKLAAAAACIILGGSFALHVLEQLLIAILRNLPSVAR